MRRIAGLSLLLAFSLTAGACTRPAPIEGTPPVEIETVASRFPSSTSPPSATSPPTATIPHTPTPSPTPTPTVGPTLTATVPPLPTSDPRYGLNLAAPSYRDDFSSNLTWVGPNFEGALNVWDDGRLRATDYVPDSFLWWSTTKPDIDAGNVYTEVTGEIGECSGKDSYGIAVRVESEHRNSGYAFEISCDGAYRLRKLFSGSIQTLIEWTPSVHIRSGTGEMNRLGFLAEGTTLAVFVNGDLLAEVEDSAFFSGNYGLYANAVETPGLTVHFDDFELWYISQ